MCRTDFGSFRSCRRTAIQAVDRISNSNSRQVPRLAENETTSHRRDDGLALRDAFILAAVRCAPPANKPTPEEIVNCLPHFDAELNALPNVSVVVALGKIGFDAYLNLLKHRGLFFRPRPA